MRDHLPYAVGAVVERDGPGSQDYLPAFRSKQ